MSHTPGGGPAKDATEAYQQFTAALEIIRDDIRGFGDGQKAMAEDIAGMKGDIGGVKGDIGGMKIHLKSLDERTERLEVDMHAVKDHLGLNGVAKPAKRPAKRRPKK